MQIAQASGKNCTARAISTMRLALGYETGLPEIWGEMGTKSCVEFVTLLGDCFPDRTVLLFCPPSELEKAVLLDNVKYLGVDWDGSDNGQIDWDDYLIAFSYGDLDVDAAHMVVGAPVVYKPSTFTVHIIFAVSLQKDEETPCQT